ncbi:MAG: hypothetical protein HON43_06870 [Alphaproteobacteria bacterium]|jgi:hypothetical protein|nr:hypothetical protein [Alphaproteobacteria bacterium]MBT5540591.1 hypothetical protein [Alphaproteobacteria bacterium]
MVSKIFRFSLAVLMAFNVLSTSVQAISDPSLEELYTNVRAVHATDYFPIGGEIIAGKRPFTDDLKSQVRQTNTPELAAAMIRANEELAFRPFVLFSLGSLTPPVDRVSNWEKRKYAVVTAFGDIKNQIFSLHPHDTALLGNVMLPTNGNTYVIIPESERNDPKLDTLDNGIQRIFYNPKAISLRKTIDQVINDSKGWNFELGSYDSTDKYKKLRPSVKYRGKEIVLSDFFGEYLKGNSQVPLELTSSGRYNFIGKKDCMFARDFPRQNYLGGPVVSSLYRSLVVWNLNHMAHEISHEDQYPTQSKEDFNVQYGRFLEYAGKEVPSADEQSTYDHVGLTTEDVPLPKSPTLSAEAVKKHLKEMNPNALPDIEAFQEIIRNLSQLSDTEMLAFISQKDLDDSLRPILLGSTMLKRFFDYYESKINGEFVSDAKLEGELRLAIFAIKRANPSSPVFNELLMLNMAEFSTRLLMNGRFKTMDTKLKSKFLKEPLKSVLNIHKFEETGMWAMFN